MKPPAQPLPSRSGRFRTARGSPPKVQSAPLLPYRVFIAYASVPAARQAMARVATLVRARGARFTLLPMLWRCDQLETTRWREVALRDASRADLIVLAMADDSSLGANTEEWLAQLAAHMRGAELKALAFTGDDEGWTISLCAPHAAAASASVHAGPEGHAASAPSLALIEKDEHARAA